MLSTSTLYRPNILNTQKCPLLINWHFLYWRYRSIACIIYVETINYEFLQILKIKT